MCTKLFLPHDYLDCVQFGWLKVFECCVGGKWLEISLKVTSAFPKVSQIKSTIIHIRKTRKNSTNAPILLLPSCSKAVSHDKTSKWISQYREIALGKHIIQFYWQLLSNWCNLFLLFILSLFLRSMLFSSDLTLIETRNGSIVSHIWVFTENFVYLLNFMCFLFIYF